MCFADERSRKPEKEPPGPDPFGHVPVTTPGGARPPVYAAPAAHSLQPLEAGTPQERLYAVPPDALRTRLQVSLSRCLLEEMMHMRKLVHFFSQFFVPIFSLLETSVIIPIPFQPNFFRSFWIREECA